MRTSIAALIADIKFAEESAEFTSRATMLRYAAAINPQATRKEFIAACVEAGHKATSAKSRFYESRVFDRDSYGLQIDKEGRLFGEETN